MKKLFLLLIVLISSFNGFAQSYTISCQGYYLSTPDQGIRNVNVTAMGTDGTVLGSCNTGSNTNCSITGDARMLTASYTFEHGYTKQKSLETDSYTVRAGFDESYVRESPTPLKEIDSNPSSSYPSGFKQMGSFVFYTAFTSDKGFQLWRYEPATNSQLMISFNVGNVGNVQAFWIVGTKIFFASDGVLYRVDNPTSTLVSVTTVYNGLGLYFSPSPLSSVVVGQYLYFTNAKAAPSTGTGLYRLDAATSDVVTIDINGTSGNAALYYVNAPELVYVAPANVVYFVANDGTTANTQLWKLPISSTTAIQLSTFTFGDYPKNLVAWNDRLYFSVGDAIYGTELYKTYLSGNGVYLAADINPGAASSNPSFLTPAVDAYGQNELYFNTTLGIYRINASDVFTPVLNVSNKALSTNKPMLYNASISTVFFINPQSGNPDRLYYHSSTSTAAEDLTFRYSLQPDKENFEMAQLANGMVFNEIFPGGIRYISEIYFNPNPNFRTRKIVFDNILPSLKGQPKFKNLTSVNPNSSNNRVYFSAINDATRGFEPSYMENTPTFSVVEMPEVNSKPPGILNPMTIQTVNFSNSLVFNPSQLFDRFGRFSLAQTLLKTQERQKFQNPIDPPGNQYKSLYAFGNRLFVLKDNSSGNQIISYQTAGSGSLYTAPITSFDGPSGISNTLYFTSSSGAAGTRGLWKTDAVATTTPLIDAESVLLFTKTYAWNNGVYYSKWSGGGGGAFYRYDHSTGVRSTIFSGGVNVTDFLEFNGYLFCRFSSGTGYGGIFRTDGTTRTFITLPTTSGGVTIPPAENVEARVVGNRLVVAAKRGTNWFIYSSTDGVNFVENFSQIPNLKIIGGVGTKLLATTGASAPFPLSIYDISNNSSTIAGLNFSSINYFPTIDNTVPSSQRIYFVGTPDGATGNFLFRMDQTGLSFNLPVQLGNWVNVVNRPSPITLVGRSVYFVGTDATGNDKYGTEMWVYNPERCPNGIMLASPTDNLIPPIGDTDFLSNGTIQATNKIRPDYASQNAGVLYSAANSITLLPGFEAKSGMNATSSGPKTISFKAQIQGCSSVFPR